MGRLRRLFRIHQSVEGKAKEKEELEDPRIFIRSSIMFSVVV
jgi:hypothetical protein